MESHKLFFVQLLIIRILTTHVMVTGTNCTWPEFYQQVLTQCTHVNIYTDYNKVLNHTLSCFKVNMFTCLYQQTLNHTSNNNYDISDVCYKASLLSPTLMADVTLVYTITIKVQPRYTIDATFIKFRMDKSPFGCKRNVMEAWDGDKQLVYCGIRDQWSEYTSTHVLKLILRLVGAGSHLQIELYSSILDIVQEEERYKMLPATSVYVYRGHPWSEDYVMDRLMTSWDPIQVLLYVWLICYRIANCIGSCLNEIFYLIHRKFLHTIYWCTVKSERIWYLTSLSHHNVVVQVMMTKYGCRFMIHVTSTLDMSCMKMVNTVVYCHLIKLYFVIKIWHEYLKLTACASLTFFDDVRA